MSASTSAAPARAPSSAASLTTTFLGWMTSIGGHHAGKRLASEPAQPARPSQRIVGGLIVFLALLFSGCAGSFNESKGSLKLGAPPPSERCVSLDDGRRNWSAVARTSGLLAGASGLSTIPVDTQELRIGLAAGTATLAAVTVFATVQSDGLGERWAAECSAP